MIILGVTLFNYGTHALMQTITYNQTLPPIPTVNFVELMLPDMTIFTSPIPQLS